MLCSMKISIATEKMEVPSWNLEVAEADVLAEITGGEVRVWCLLLIWFLPVHPQQ